MALKKTIYIRKQEYSLHLPLRRVLNMAVFPRTSLVMSMPDNTDISHRVQLAFSMRLSVYKSCLCHKTSELVLLFTQYCLDM